MKRYLFLLMLVNFSLFGQTEEIDSIEMEMKKIDSEIRNLTYKKANLKAILDSKKSQAISNSDEGFLAQIGNFGANLYDNANFALGKSLKKLNAGDSIQVIKFVSEQMVEVSHNGLIGYVTINRIASSPKIDQLYYSNISDSKGQRFAYLSRKFGTSVANRIEKKQVWIGMTKAMARESQGSPSNITKNEFSWGTTEYWHYERNNRLYRTLYFQNDKLDSFSDY